MAHRSLPLLDNPHHIIVRMPNWLGDLVMATPILTDLHHHWPDAKITAMCQGALGTVIQEDPHIDACINFQKNQKRRGQHPNLDPISFLKKENFDLGILLTNSFSSAYAFWRGGVRYRIGYARHWRSLLLNSPVLFPAERKHQHLVLTYKMLLEPLGISVSSTSPRLYLTFQEQQAVKETLTNYGIQTSDFLLGINPGAAYGSAKCWLPDRFKKLCRRLLDKPDLKILLFGDKGGAELVQDICAGLPADRVINLAAKTTVRELMAFIQACHLFLTNDSGPMHVASALGTPLIALFGSTSDLATGPYGGKARVIHKHVPCSPCHRRECPIDFRCMTRIEVQEVYEEIVNFQSSKS